ncbi:GNAT family N-acetyltransferase [Domibacillus antri]|uniref:GNAT family N-acetyltransferase n=1 Tax=Domibacillus antri TaxID=1714264 RepID=A0A1Q8Q468_9BACI|nr:GNAT family N-acetyltransferase [Domibacillus antri]OLN22140.1 GNAT family N-acetyltransferase [Domibacillus antri]
MKIYQTYDYEMVAKLNKPVHDLHSKLYPAYFKKYNYPDAEELFKHLINVDSFVFFIVEDNGEARGYAWIEIRNYPENAFNKEFKSVYVQQISTTENQRRKGYGSKLMGKIYDFAKSIDIDLIELDYWIENSEAKEFYKKQGFKQSREFVYKQL